MDSFQYEDRNSSSHDAWLAPPAQPVEKPKTSPHLGYIFAGLSFAPFIGIIFGGAGIIIAGIRKSVGAVILSIFGIIINFIFIAFIMNSLFTNFISTANETFSTTIPDQITRTDIELIQKEIIKHKNDNGELPELLSDLEQSKDTPSLSLVDGWQRDFMYIPNDDGTFRLSSNGPDGIALTNDDIFSSQSTVPDKGVAPDYRP